MMGSDGSRNPLSTDAIMVGYAMSRLDRKFLAAFNFKSWQEAFRSVGERLSVRTSSLKNLRDEFDPLHDNSRVGWWRRELREGRRSIHCELSEVDDIELLSVIESILGTASRGIRQDKLARRDNAAMQVAARLRTGRAAEAYFAKRSEEIFGIQPKDVLDMRDSLAGFDFRLRRVSPPWLVEVKGLGARTGRLRFTDLEWRVAERARLHYAVVVVHSLSSSPDWEVIVDPTANVKSVSRVEKRLTIAWEASFRPASAPLH